MDYDDVIYISLLLFSIVGGHYYRQLPNDERKKWIGTAGGFLIVFIVSGLDVWHPLLVTGVNIAIIKLISKQKCHIVSFIFSFLYLLFFRSMDYFGLEYPKGHINLIQMILTLKLVGLALEVTTSPKKEIDPTVTDIFHYAFNFIGVLTGPYYRYQTFKDYFELPLAKYSPSVQATIAKFEYIPLYVILFLWGTYNWPLSYALSDEFYMDRSWIYRFWYCWPTFFIFRMRIYIGIVLSECVCTAAGFGCYPTICEAKPGEGPSKSLEVLAEISKDEGKLAKETYDFETIHNVRPYDADFCTTVREGMKHWNICIQYWLAVNVYKRFPSKKYRTYVTLLVSAFWHGVYVGHWICIGSVPFYLIVEDIWVKLLLKEKGKYTAIYEWILWFAKMQAFSYMAIAFRLLTMGAVFTYYNSIYHVGTIMNVILFASGAFLLKKMKNKTSST